MLGKLGCFVVALSLVLPAGAGEKPGSISGYVRNAGGTPQMGALVEILGSAAHSLQVFTDASGYYSAEGLLPGIYNLRVSAPYFLPALRPHIGLHTGGGVVVNVTLSTLFDAVEFAPWRGSADEDDWKWVLRSASNRPILRLVNGSTQSPAPENSFHDLKGSLSFLAGSPAQGFGSASDMSTGFSVEKSLFSSGTVAVAGNVGYGEGAAAAVVRASYTHKLSNGSEPQVTLTMRSLPALGLGLPNASLQAVALTTSDDFTLGDVLELKFGSELQTIQFMGRVNAFRPFGSAGLHLSPNTVVEYQYATSEPDSRLEKGFDSAPADLSESGPRVSIAGYSPALEHAHHQEVALSRRAGDTNLQVAVYADRIADPALTGVGDFTEGSGGEVLSDPYSGTFTYQGNDLETHGVRVVAQRKLTSDLTATVDYSYGGVLDLAKPDVSLAEARQSITMRERHSVAGKVSGRLPNKSTWIASYRWVSGSALTPVDMFNSSPGQADPYLSIFFRQPIPGFLPGHVDALIDIRNLLAQGYVPVVGSDGRTVYLVQDARTVRGGVAFTF